MSSLPFYNILNKVLLGNVWLMGILNIRSKIKCSDKMIILWIELKFVFFSMILQAEYPWFQCTDVYGGLYFCIYFIFWAPLFLWYSDCTSTRYQLFKLDEYVARTNTMASTEIGYMFKNWMYFTCNVLDDLNYILTELSATQHKTIGEPC